MNLTLLAVKHRLAVSNVFLILMLALAVALLSNCAG